MRQNARERDAAEVAPAVRKDMKFHVERSVAGRADVLCGDSVCFRCGVRSSVGCKYRSGL